MVLEFDGVSDAFGSCILCDVSIALTMIKSWANVPSLVCVETPRVTAARLSWAKIFVPGGENGVEVK